MATLDGKITIGIEYRPCMVHIPEHRELRRKANEDFPREIVIAPAQDIKAIFHTWNTFTGKGIVEYEDGTVHEVEPQNIRFVDNAMCEYAFPDKSKDVEKQEDADWHCPNCKDGIMRIDDSMVLTSNPPQYQYKCDKCGHVEYSNQVNRTMTQTTLWSGKQHRPAETWKPDA